MQTMNRSHREEKVGMGWWKTWRSFSFHWDSCCFVGSGESSQGTRIREKKRRRRNQEWKVRKKLHLLFKSDIFFGLKSHPFIVISCMSVTKESNGLCPYRVTWMTNWDCIWQTGRALYTICFVSPTRLAGESNERRASLITNDSRRSCSRSSRSIRFKPMPMSLAFI